MVGAQIKARESGYNTVISNQHRFPSPGRSVERTKLYRHIRHVTFPSRRLPLRSPAPYIYPLQRFPHQQIMSTFFTHKFDTPVFSKDVSFCTGLFINGQFVDGVKRTTIESVLLIDFSGIADPKAFRLINPSMFLGEGSL